MAAQNAKRILLSPLDWGLGHTSRCIPIIQYLQSLGHAVIVAGNEWQRRFIERSCPAIETIHLDGYNVSYSRSAPGFMFSIFRQIPRLLKTMRKENDWLIEHAAKLQFDGIISDNRYGMFHKRIPSVIMTHQLMAKTGTGKVADEMLRRLHYKYLERFNKCWVVDVAGQPNLSGKLAHPKTMPDNAGYIGLLSQFEKGTTTIDGDHLLVLLSGPEPQRSLLSDKLWQQVKQHNGKVIFVEGSNNTAPRMDIPAHVEYHRQLTKTELQPLLEQAGLVICRSGYSTLMDLVTLNKKAIIIPTPGQTEQVYLAKHLHKEGIFLAASQRNFNLARAIASSKLFPFKQLALQGSFNNYKAVLDNWIGNL